MLPDVCACFGYSIGCFHCRQAGYLVICNTNLGCQFGCSRKGLLHGCLAAGARFIPGPLTRVLQEVKAASACVFMDFVASASEGR